MTDTPKDDGKVEDMEVVNVEKTDDVVPASKDVPSSSAEPQAAKPDTKEAGVPAETQASQSQPHADATASEPSRSTEAAASASVATETTSAETTMAIHTAGTKEQEATTATTTPMPTTAVTATTSTAGNITDKVDTVETEGKAAATLAPPATTAEDATMSPASPTMSGNKRSAVDASFERLFGYKWGTQFHLDDEERVRSMGIRPADADALLGIFGATRAARILRVVSTGKRQKTSRSGLGFMPSAQTNLRASSAHPRAAVLQSTHAMRKPVDRSEIENIKLLPKDGSSVDPTNPTTSTPATAINQRAAANAPAVSTTPAAAAPSGVDQVLAQIAGPAKVNTVQKTSNDWESFKKTDAQLQEDLEKKAQGKDAYLVKQDFLTRVDNRRFEIERGERERERAKRATT